MMPTRMPTRQKNGLDKPDESGVSSIQSAFTPREVEIAFIQFLAVATIPIAVVGWMHIQKFSSAAKFLLAPGLHLAAQYIPPLPRPQPLKWNVGLQVHEKR